jgi:hypothetical protein
VLHEKFECRKNQVVRVGSEEVAIRGRVVKVGWW